MEGRWERRWWWSGRWRNRRRRRRRRRAGTGGTGGAGGAGGAAAYTAGGTAAAGSGGGRGRGTPRTRRWKTTGLAATGTVLAVPKTIHLGPSPDVGFHGGVRPVLGALHRPDVEPQQDQQVLQRQRHVGRLAPDSDRDQVLLPDQLPEVRQPCTFGLGAHQVGLNFDVHLSLLLLLLSVATLRPRFLLGGHYPGLGVLGLLRGAGCKRQVLRRRWRRQQGPLLRRQQWRGGFLCPGVGVVRLYAARQQGNRIDVLDRAQNRQRILHRLGQPMEFHRTHFVERFSHFEGRQQRGQDHVLRFVRGFDRQLTGVPALKGLLVDVDRGFGRGCQTKKQFHGPKIVQHDMGGRRDKTTHGIHVLRGSTHQHIVEAKLLRVGRAVKHVTGLFVHGGRRLVWIFSPPFFLFAA